MTPEEAIEILEEVKELDDTMYAYSPAYMSALDMAISSLKEIQQYRAIGTVEECREAVKKQNYMKIKTIEDMCFECAKCKELVAHDDGWNTYNYCPNCGQKLSGIE